ncbi:hypothetical protein ACHMW4_24860 [Mesorhizobium sp. UC22_110]|uniref:hypothetical protein n=1 Tax=unclassified Mesorhizobium TaxID=325217 RepID=UPI0036728F5E
MTLGRTIASRIGSLLLTLWLLSVLVFFAGQVLPGDVGRVMLGPFADAEAVAALNRKLGTDQPVLVQYWSWFEKAIQGDFGVSLSLRQPVAPRPGKPAQLGGAGRCLPRPADPAGYRHRHRRRTESRKSH